MSNQKASIPASNSIQDGIRHAPGGGAALMHPGDVALLLLDHQTGLFQTVKDISVSELRANTAMLAKLAALMNLPVIQTASEPEGPNGPLMPEIKQFAPHAVFVHRKGEVNAWDNEAFVKAVEETGKKTLIMAGVWTSVCVMFPALDANAVLCELQRTWNRKDAAQFAQLYTMVAPNYGAVMESYGKAQEVARQQHEAPAEVAGSR